MFFDLDGVLIDSRPGIVECVNATLAKFGFEPVSVETILDIIGPPLGVGFRQLLAAQDADDAGLVTACVINYRKLYAAGAAVDGSELQPGIAEMLSILRQHAFLSVATSKPLQFVEPILAALEIRDAFRVVVGPTSETNDESKVSILRGAMDQVREADPAYVAGGFMVGDRKYDVAAARENGLFAIGVAWGYGSVTELEAAGADVIVETPERLISLVLGNGSRL